MAVPAFSCSLCCLRGGESFRSEALPGKHHLLFVAAGAGQCLRLGKRTEKAPGAVAVAGDANGQIPFSHGPKQPGRGVGPAPISP